VQCTHNTCVYVCMCVCVCVCCVVSHMISLQTYKTQYENATKTYMKSILMLLGADDDPDSGLDDAINQIYAIEKDLAEVQHLFSALSCIIMFLLYFRYFCLLLTCVMSHSRTM